MRITRKRLKLLSLLMALTLALPVPASAVYADQEYDASGAVSFVFADSGVSADAESGTGWEIDGTDLKITEAGTYIVSGSCADGSITVKKDVSDVSLVLNGITLTSSYTAPIACNKSSHVTIVAAAGTLNTLTDSEKNNDDSYPDNTAAENAVIKCKDGSQVTICGSGGLNIVSNGKNGIKSGASTDEEGEAWLKIQDVTLNISGCPNDGINAEAMLSIASGTITVSAADDAVHCDYDLDIGTAGSGPTISVTDSYEGIEASDISIYSGDIDIHADDDGINAANSDLKGSSFSITIAGGSVYINTETGDGIDSNGTISVSGGVTEIYSGSASDNSPFDSERGMTVSGGSLFAVGYSGMAETPAGSQAYAVFGSGGRMTGGRGGWNLGLNDGRSGMESDMQDSEQIRSDLADGTGGTDGPLPEQNGRAFDRTGGFNPDMNGGTAPGTNDGSAPELNGGAAPGTNDGSAPELNGGVAPGTNDGSAPGLNGDALQGSAVSVSAGDTISIRDSSGNTLYEGTAVRSANYVFFSSEDLTEGGAYSLCINDESVAEASGAVGSDNGNMTASRPDGNPAEDNMQQPDNGANADGAENADSPAAGSDSAGGFSDVSADDWFYDSVMYVLNKGLMNGASASAFNPYGTASRGMIAAMLYRLEGSPDVSDTCPFADVADGQYYADAVTWAASKGIVSGITDESFAPDDNISREQIAAILYRYADYKGCDTSAQADLSSFADNSSISGYAKAPMAWANQTGIINGVGGGALNPDSSATRAQIAASFMRFCENISV